MAATDNAGAAGAPGGWAAFSPRAWWRHVVWLIAALAAGAAALYFNYAEGWAVRFGARAGALSPVLPPLIVGVGLIVISRLRDRVFPGTDGTGIPQTIAALKMGEGPARRRVLSARIALGKLVLLTLGLFCGATIGREGPSVHVAACCLYLGTRFARFPQHLVERGLILAGGAAGIAAAFNTPIAGIVFAFEEIGRSFEKDNAGTIVRTVAVACLLCMVALSDYLFYGRVDTHLTTVAQWLVVVPVGLAGGLLGGVFAQGVAVTTPRVRRLSRRRPYAVAGSLGLALAVLGVVSAGETYGSGYDQARHILIDGQMLPRTYAVAKALASFVSLISAIPGGLFDPSLSVGAGLGQLVQPLAPHVPPQALVMLAMAAYFAGVVQSPITAAVILLEMTAARGMALPLLAASVLAYEASRLVCRVSLYESLALSFLQAAERR